ncbi:HNH endonuclease signature motif containing protein [Microbacterium rhizomatis]|uniref:DUF222 domain-containing protein n=1 Tax=Microbacterium rhizomatis TaxID=1631477 RepID=A0A5J5J339_9MICO|nr:HNH endonuclease signature motif containing protein [Microbacterium rhizomatis]KAA9107628.1 DUF222 domain-containing protein [Microbacterium rhizomatis]
MNILSSLRDRVARLAAWDELDVEVSALPSHAVRLSDVSVLDALADVTALANDAARLQAVLAGVAAQRSRREDGAGGLAAGQGFATPASLIQSITGGTKADASRQVRVGVALLEGIERVPDSTDGDDPAAAPALPSTPWHEPLRVALLDGRLTSVQSDAIRVGLGEPVVAGRSAARSAVNEAWTLAAEGLIIEATGMPVEELGKRARIIRDLLDPTGAEERFARRYENRAYRAWIDADGQRHARITYDDEMGLWVDAILDAALRPRRGGPRFVTAGERESAAHLRDDPRTNEQLAYDLLMDLVRAGSLATASDVFGTRQPGVRLVMVNDIAGPRDAFGRLIDTGHAENGGDALPGSVIDRAICVTGTVTITTDRHGNPLDLGRTHRTYTARQTLALAARDGGCMWTGCTRPASYCEAHHIDPYSEGGRTDIDRGILLCRHHHMTLHNHGWKISRDGRADFLLHPPGGATPVTLTSKAAWKWAWDPPPPPECTTWRTVTSA